MATGLRDTNTINMDHTHIRINASTEFVNHFDIDSYPTCGNIGFAFAARTKTSRCQNFL